LIINDEKYNKMLGIIAYMMFGHID